MAGPSAESGHEITTLLLTCRAVNLSAVKSDANTVLVEATAEEIRSYTNFFSLDGTKVSGDIVGADTTNLTFNFQVTVKLARPMKL